MNEVASIIAGDEFGFEQVYNQYHEKLFFFFLKQTRSREDAEELVQLSFIKLWKGRENLSPDFSISQQLFRIGKSCLIDMFRQQSKEKVGRHAFADHTLQTQNAAMEPDFDLKDHLVKAIDQLPSVRRQVFIMSRIEQLSHKEISKELSVSMKTVESHIYKALQQIRKSMGLFFLL